MLLSTGKLWHSIIASGKSPHLTEAEMAARASIPHISLVESIKFLMYMLIVIQSNKLLLALGSFNFDTASG
jgi:hypothetical protein